MNRRALSTLLVDVRSLSPGLARAETWPWRDSRLVTPGDLFFACGAQAERDVHLREALRRGALAVVCQAPAPSAPGCPLILVDDVRGAFAAASAAAHGLANGRHPPLLGVTGTDGKTSVVQVLWQALGPGAGRIGTLGWHDGHHERPGTQTTPPPEEIHAFLAGLDTTCPGVALEVSSHGADQGRLMGLTLAAGVFTGLGRDHLDYHETIESYAAAKLRVAALLGRGAPCVVNADGDLAQPFGRAASAAGAVPVTLGFAAGAARIVGRPGAWRLAHAGEERLLPARLPGRLNAWNLAAAWLVGRGLGIGEEALADRLAGIRAIPGRMELLAQSPATYVDYAHTPAAIARLLGVLREEHPGRRLVCVFGCGGNRDRGKRPLMAQAAMAADAVVLTNDNPRDEDPAAIARDALAGLPPGTTVSWDASAPATVSVMLDRGAAIRAGRVLAGPQGVLAVLGKGHEAYQEIAGRKTAWDDRSFVAGFGGSP